MHHRTLIIGVSIGAIAPLASAQGTGIWLWEVNTDNGDAIVEPGETANITLSVHLIPNPPQPFVALAATVFDTLGGMNASKGQIVGWEVHNNLADLTGDVTTTDGVSLFGTNAGQLTVFGPFVSDNPIDVMTFQWAPDDLGTYTVSYMTDTDNMTAWQGEDKDSAMAVTYAVAEAAISFQVVPSPGPAALGALAAAVFIRRRR